MFSATFYWFSFSTFFSEEILKTDKAFWVSPGGKLLAYCTFDDSQVREHSVNAFLPDKKVAFRFKHRSFQQFSKSQDIFAFKD